MHIIWAERVEHLREGTSARCADKTPRREAGCLGHGDRPSTSLPRCPHAVCSFGLGDSSRSRELCHRRRSGKTGPGEQRKCSQQESERNVELKGDIQICSVAVEGGRRRGVVTGALCSGSQVQCQPSGQLK